MPEWQETPPRPLLCAQCGCRSTGAARGWRAYLGGDDTAGLDPLELFTRLTANCHVDSAPEVLMFCPDCGARQFDAE